MQRLLIVVAGLVTAYLLLVGSYFLVDALAIDHHERTVRVDTVDTVELDGMGAGTLRVVGDSPEGARVDFRWREGLRDAELSARVDGGRLVVRTDCPAVFDTFCRVDATVHVPPGTDVVGRASSRVEVVDVGGTIDLDVQNGSTLVERASGRVRIDGDNGRVEVVDSSGTFELDSDNGSVRATGITAGAISATSTNGSVHLDLRTPADTVRASSDNGSVTILVPRGTTWATTLRSDNGEVDSPVRTDPTADRSIVADSDNGSVSVRYRT